MLVIAAWELQRFPLDLHDRPRRLMCRAPSQPHLMDSALDRSSTVDPEVWLRADRILWVDGVWTLAITPGDAGRVRVEVDLL